MSIEKKMCRFNFNFKYILTLAQNKFKADADW